MKRVGFALVLLGTWAPARADVSARLSLSTMMLSESAAGDPASTDASSTLLFYGDLRATVEGRKLGGGFEFKGDFRLRLTGNFDEAAALVGDKQGSARGYAGGREYDLREAWMGRRGESWDLGVGRLIVRESDALTVDGARLWWRFHPAWHASIFGGLYPNPYARSLPDDYTGGPAGGAGFVPALAAGADLAYAYPRVWGSASIAGAWLGGAGDGGPIVVVAGAAGPAPAATGNEPGRAYVTWTNYLRAAKWLDLFHDLVVDVAGATGPQLTRADVGAQLGAGPLRVNAGYDHLSSLAIETWLLRLLNDRRGFVLGTIENNLIVQRTARDEGRLRASLRFAHFDLYSEGRVRRRALLAPERDPNFAAAASATPGLSWEVTGGLRDDGDLAGLRLGAWFTEIADVRAETRLLGLDAGRDFAGERLSIDLGFRWQGNRDAASAGDPACAPIATPSAPLGALGATCYGRRTGDLFEVGGAVAARPDRRWFLLVDYRLLVDRTEGAPAILSHVLFARVEVRM